MTAFIGKHYLNKRGLEELLSLRVGPQDDLKVTDGNPPIELLARVPSDECGCPEEVWSIDGMILLFHFEEDGSSDVFLFAGDWEHEGTLEATSLDDLRAKAFQWFSDLMDCAND